MIEEQFMNIEGFGSRYQISNLGRVYSTITDRFKAIKHKSNGYKAVDLSLNGKHYIHHIHRLVAIAFIPNPHNKPAVNHIDGDKSNNTVTNLEWVTASENMTHAAKTGLLNCEYQQNRMVPVYQFTLDGEFITKFESSADAERCTGVSQGSIRSAVRLGRSGRSGGFIWTRESVETTESTLISGSE